MACTLELALRVDGELDALKTGRESRLASCQMGRQVMKVAAEPIQHNRLLRDYRMAIEEKRSPGHLPVAIGLTLAVCGWSRSDSVAAYLYQAVQGFVSSSMKLLPVGQQEGQQLLSRWTPLIAEISHRVKPQDQLVSWSPVHDIFVMRHARLESRLFRS
jgi:urease accessory protein